MKLLDSSIWLAHLVDAHSKASELMENDELLFCSILSLFEIEKKLRKDGYPEEKIEKMISFMTGRSVIINLTENIVRKSAKISLQYGLAAIDALIYATAMEQNSILITADNDFRNLPKVEIIDK